MEFYRRAGIYHKHLHDFEHSNTNNEFKIGQPKISNIPIKKRYIVFHLLKITGNLQPDMRVEIRHVKRKQLAPFLPGDMINLLKFEKTEKEKKEKKSAKKEKKKVSVV